MRLLVAELVVVRALLPRHHVTSCSHTRYVPQDMMVFEHPRSRSYGVPLFTNGLAVVHHRMFHLNPFARRRLFSRPVYHS